MSPSEMSDAMDVASGVGSDLGTTGGIDAPASSYSDSNYDPFAGFGSYADEPNVGTAYLGLDTPVYGSSGMTARNAINALVGMQAYPYVPAEVSPTFNSFRGIPSWAMLSEDPKYGFREPTATVPPEPVALSPVGPATTPTQPGLDTPLYGRSGMNEREAVRSLVDMGYGNLEGINRNNPDQTAQQLLNSYRAHDFLNEYAPALFTAGMPAGMGLAFNATRKAGEVLSGRTTPGQALTSVGLDALASKLGIPGGGRVVADLLEGRVGPAAGNAAAGLATGIAGRAGLGPFAGPLLNELGITPAISKATANAVQPQPGQGTGVVSSLADAISRGAQGIMGLFGGTPAAAIPATPGTGTTRGYTPPDYNQYESGGPEPQPATTPAAAPAVEPETAAARRLLYGMAQGPYGPLLAYDFGEA